MFIEKCTNIKLFMKYVLTKHLFEFVDVNIYYFLKLGQSKKSLTWDKAKLTTI